MWQGQLARDLLLYYLLARTYTYFMKDQRNVELNVDGPVER